MNTKRIDQVLVVISQFRAIQGSPRLGAQDIQETLTEKFEEQYKLQRGRSRP